MLSVNIYLVFLYLSFDSFQVSSNDLLLLNPVLHGSQPVAQVVQLLLLQIHENLLQPALTQDTKVVQMLLLQSSFSTQLRKVVYHIKVMRKNNTNDWLNLAEASSLKHVTYKHTYRLSSVLPTGVGCYKKCVCEGVGGQITMSVCLFLCLCLYLCLCVCICLSLSVCLNVCFLQCMFVSLYVYLCLSQCLSVSLHLSLCMHVCHSLYI